MARVLIIDERDGLAEMLVSRLRESVFVKDCQRALPGDLCGPLGGRYAGLCADRGIDIVVYSPPLQNGKRMTPDLADAEALFESCANVCIPKVILLSSALVYGAGHHNPGFVSETRTVSRNGKNSIGAAWLELEETARVSLRNTDAKLTILRPSIVVVPGAIDYFSGLFAHRLGATLAGHDPSLQILSAEDLAGAVRCAVESSKAGVYNVAPDSVIPLGDAFRLGGTKRIPLFRWVQRAVRKALRPMGLAHSIDQLEYIRYSWTVSNEKIKRDFGFIPSRSSAQALIASAAEKRVDSRVKELAGRRFDDFGMDEDYIAALSRTLFRFLHRYYWRVEVNGLERVPCEGRAVLVGVHRGFMPWDAAMLLHLLAERLGRYPRFLIHPGLIKFPFLFNLFTKVGGVIACRENADRILERDELLGVFPEGVRGGFRLYREAYSLGKFGRDEFVKMALRNRAPIIPFVTVGSAEAFPILGKIEWTWWRRYSEWPFIPLTPTFPFSILPLPLPSKWHTQFLAPIHVEREYAPEAAGDPATVRAISQEVKGRLEMAIEQMLNRRRSIFFGSVFDTEVGG